jgi:3-hydroxyacyl-[acyl-carrier-protein] dehydratase
MIRLFGAYDPEGMVSDAIFDVADIGEIFRLLPHRYPFLLINRITDIRGADHGIGIKNLTMNELQFGHSENPVTPGVLVIEGLAQNPRHRMNLRRRSPDGPR